MSVRFPFISCYYAFVERCMELSIMSKGIVYSLDIITASMRLRLRGRGVGLGWMISMEGWWILCGLRWVSWLGLPLSFSVIIDSLLDKSFLPLSLLSSNHRRLPSIGLFLPSRSTECSKWNDLKSLDWLNNKRWAAASDDQMRKMRLLCGRKG